MRHSKLQRQVDGAVHETEEAAVRLLGALGRFEHAKCATAQTPTARQSLVPVTALTRRGLCAQGAAGGAAGGGKAKRPGTIVMS